MGIQFQRTIPILRIFDEQKANEFYVDCLGFKVDWERRFEPNTPIYMQISRGKTVLHLSEHYGDGTPGTTLFLDMVGLDEFHQELTTQRYKYFRPGIQDVPWNARMMALIDPLGIIYVSINTKGIPKRTREKNRRRAGSEIQSPAIALASRQWVGHRGVALEFR